MVAGDTRVFRNNQWERQGRTPIPNSAASNPVGFNQQVFADQFATLDASRWFAYNNSNFGSSMNVLGYYKDYNVEVGASGARSVATAGATNGTSLRILCKRESGVGPSPSGWAWDFTSGMLDTRSRNFYIPRYFRCETRSKIPHGQALWEAFWFVARNNGASTAEYDGYEYFHAQRPGRVHVTLWGKVTGTENAASIKYTNNQGSPNRLFFENPTYTPGWHDWAFEVVPVTDATGTVLASPSAVSQYVRYTTYLDGAVGFRFVDTTSTWMMTNGGSEDSFWNIFIQGELGGNDVGHPDDALGYSRYRGTCLTGSGTPPTSCATSFNGQPILRAGAPGSTATLDVPSTIHEIDFVKVWKFTG